MQIGTVVKGRGGVVSAGHPATAAAGAEILARGGNAVDAVVAAMFTAFHSEPLLTSAAGGGFLVTRVDGEPAAWDFFARAPGLGTGAKPYQAPDGAFWGETVDFGSATQTFHIGPGSIATSFALQGLAEAQQQAGRLTLKEVCEPAWKAAHEGTVMTQMGAFVSVLLEPIVRAVPEFEKYFIDDEGNLIAPGTRFHNPDLAKLWDAVAADGGRVLTQGPLADRLLAEVRGKGGGLTAQDLAQYQTSRTQPFHHVLTDGTELLAAPMPSSSGMLIAFADALFAGFDTPSFGSAAEVLLRRAVIAEAFHARAVIIGNETPSQAHADRMLSDKSIAVGRAAVRKWLDLGVGELPEIPSNELGSTTHISAIDADGNAAATTCSNGECSTVIVPGTGVFLNNFLGEDDINPGGFHRLAPGTPMGSSMCPMLLNSAKHTVALGSGGSNRIWTALLQTTRNLLVHGKHPARAVNSDRVHFEAGKMAGEAANDMRDALDALVAEGLQLGRFDAPNMFFGGTHLAIRSADTEVLGVGDERRSGAAAVT